MFRGTVGGRSDTAVDSRSLGALALTVIGVVNDTRYQALDREPGRRGVHVL
jgi:hypothetical protein